MSSRRHEGSSANPILLEATRRLIERRLSDPVGLAALAGFELDAWQRDVLLSTSRQIILLVSRQGGKSTVSSLRALHKAINSPGSLVLLLAPAYRQSKELFRKVRDALNALNAPAPLESESALEMEFSNGSRVVALPGKEATIRGFSGVSLLIVDEASRVPDALYQAVRPMLAVSGGEILLLSTPFGKRGFFFEEWEGAGEWHRARVTADECPRIPKDWLERERRQIGEWWYRQEYLCEFVETEDQVFSYEDIQRALDPEVKPLFGGVAE